MDLHCSCNGTARSSFLSIGSVSLVLLEGTSSEVLDTSSCPLFHSGQVFHELVCPFTVVLPQIFFNLNTLFSFPVFFSLFHAYLDVVVHIPVFLRSFRFKSFLSQFSPFVAQIKNLSFRSHWPKAKTTLYSDCCKRKNYSAKFQS